MSKKLLKEGTVRKFMKLANLSSFSNNFVNEKYDAMDEELEEGGMTYEGLYEEEDDALEPPGADEEGMDLGDEDDEPMGDNEEVFKRVVQAIADELGVEVDLEDATGGEDDMGDMDDEDEDEDMDLGDEDEDMEDEGDDMEDEEGGEEEALNEAILNLLNRSNIQVVDDSVMTEALVKRVAARVARRLLKESL